MTTAPNIEMIASSLRHCSLTGGAGGRRRGGTRRRGAEGGGDTDGVTVELNSEVALPYHWEQCLDIRVRPLLHIVPYGSVPSFPITARAWTPVARARVS
jgi:hypothetical protein